MRVLVIGAGGVGTPVQRRRSDRAVRAGRDSRLRGRAGTGWRPGGAVLPEREAPFNEQRRHVFKNFIDSEVVDGKHGKAYDLVDPVTGEVCTRPPPVLCP